MGRKPKMTKYNIICLSNQLWDYSSWTNKRHIMSRLAKNGHKVLFVDPQLNLGRLLIRQVLEGKWSLKRLIQRSYQDSTGAEIFNPINLLPAGRVSSFFHIKKIKSLTKKIFDDDKKTILWVYHVQLVSLADYLEKLNYDILVYDCVDNYDAFPVSRSLFPANVYGDTLKKQESNLAQTADICFASAPGLVDKLKKYNQTVFYTPNVGDYKRFKNSKSYKYKIPKKLAEISRPRIGMIGALDEYKFDAKLIKKCAEKHPKYNFVLVGPMSLKDKSATLKDIGLEGISNIHYLGPCPYEEKKYYYAGFDVDLIPYQLNDYTVGGCFPVKFHDSLAAGLPIVVTNLPAYVPFSEFCYISKTSDEFCENIKKALEEDNPTRMRQRQQVAKENDWDYKADKMIEHIESVDF